MADFGGTFDATGVAPRKDFEILPPGDYLTHITRSEFKENEAKTGSYLELELEILDGAAKGRKLFDRLNLQNPNAQAVEIAQATLSAICHATGKLTVSNSEQLHHIPMLAVVKVKPKKKNGVVQKDSTGADILQNEIATYKPKDAARNAPAATGAGGGGAASGGAPAADGGAAAGAGAGAGTGPTKLPWQR